MQESFSVAIDPSLSFLTQISSKLLVSLIRQGLHPRTIGTEAGFIISSEFKVLTIST